MRNLDSCKTWKLTDHQIYRIKLMLSTTDMSMRDIALAVGCSKFPVTCINEQFNIRPIRRKVLDMSGALNIA